MMTTTSATVFNTPAQTVVNTVNCRGVMGAGLALEFKLRYPEMFEDYARRCRAGEVRVGEPYVYKGYASPWILNFPTKLHWKDPSRIEWVEQGLEHFTRMYRKEGITSAAFPPLGCTHGGLDWAQVQPLMERHLGPLDLVVTVCLDTMPEAAGVEAKMVRIVHAAAVASGADSLGLPKDAADAVRAALPLRRFRDLARVPGLGKAAYAALFRRLYARATAPPHVLPESVKNSADDNVEKRARQLTFPF